MGAVAAVCAAVPPRHRFNFGPLALALFVIWGRLKKAPIPPRAIVVVSGHWEEAQPTVSSSAQLRLYYDY